jgi:hypothetical protein
MASWQGQDLNAAVVAAANGTALTMGGSLAGNGQLFAWGEKKTLIFQFFDTVTGLLPYVPMSIDAPPQQPGPSQQTAQQPGWYPDPLGAPRLRWHDGSAWTDHLAEMPQAPGPN